MTSNGVLFQVWVGLDQGFLTRVHEFGLGGIFG